MTTDVSTLTYDFNPFKKYSKATLNNQYTVQLIIFMKVQLSMKEIFSIY